MSTPSERPFAGIGARIAAARDERGWNQAEFAEALGLSRQTVSRWETGEVEVPVKKRPRVAEILRTSVAALFGEIGQDVSRGTPWPLIGTAKPAVVRESFPVTGGTDWPSDWRTRALKLQLEASEAGATDDEIAVVKGWMLNPELQALWAGGAPTDLSQLEGIEIGARAWLRARKRMVKAK